MRPATTTRNSSPGGFDTYRLRSSSSLMMHAAPVRLHWAHSDSPSLTTQRILRSRHEAHAIEARWRICCLADERLDGAGLEAFSDCSDPALSLSPSERDLLFVPAMVASAVAAAMRSSLVDAVGVPVFFLSFAVVNRWRLPGHQPASGACLVVSQTGGMGRVKRCWRVRTPSRRRKGGTMDLEAGGIGGEGDGQDDKQESKKGQKRERAGSRPSGTRGAGPGCVKCPLHGEAVDNSRAEGWSMLTRLRRGAAGTQAPRSHRHAAEARFAGTGQGAQACVGPDTPPAGPLSIPIDAAVESTLGPVCAAPRGENPGFWRRQGGQNPHCPHGPRRAQEGQEGDKGDEGQQGQDGRP